MTPQGQGDPYLRLIRERYHELEALARKREQEDHERYEVVITYHSPAGAIIEVVGNIFVDTASGVLIIEGLDQQGNYCDAVACPQSTHFVLKLLPIQPEETPKPKPGFVQ